MERFLPNECYVCKSRDNLIRCDCKMISYCSENHQLEHLPIHNSFCKMIKKLLLKRKLSHIYEELTNLRGSDWGTKQIEIFEEIKNRLGRRMTPLEYFMFHRPRICFFCYKTEQENLIDCPNCPVVSFCKNHPHHDIHNINCKVIIEYLDVLDAAEELNIDLKFLPSTFPCITEEKENQSIDVLTRTFIVTDMRQNCAKSRLLKTSLTHFMNLASKLQNTLQKIYVNIPEEIVIHIDTLSHNHVIRRENYWEFLLHLNPMIRKLKIVIVVNEILNNLVNYSLCENCRSKGKELNVKIVAKSYDDYMLDENYQKPNILLYVKIINECNSERLNKWSEFNFPIVLRFASESTFCKTLQFLSLSTTKFRFIYAGHLKTQFGTLSSIDNEDYFIILQLMQNKVLQKSWGTVTDEICEETIATNTIETSLEVKKICIENLQYDENNSTDAIADASKITPSESKENSDNNEKSKLETSENQSPTVSLPEANRILIQNENTNTETEVEKNSNNETTELTENKNSNIPAEPAVHTSNDEQKEQKSEDKTLSPSPSSSFVFISEPGEEEREKKEEVVEKNSAIENSKLEENNCSNSIDNGSLETEDDEQKNDEKNNTERREEEEQKNEKDLRVNLGNVENSQTNIFQSFLIDHISYLNNEVDELRKRLNASIEEVTKQQIKYEQVFSTLIEENKLMRKTLCDIINTTADIDSVLKIKS
ncbi:uncharacterized protein LOC122508667 [Leptopilina heterotoma]|uniref:uncharacterized protein LOC122508667 n=1 Tax=Leptopilina heterotoma TaxID=63436 RepID=UPI001CAA09ED|nr:uncharacterized protein LOC122508667 [Leptopilina heterotoma]